MKVKIKSIRDDVELPATVEVAKLLAFYDLLSGLRSLGEGLESTIRTIGKSFPGLYSKVRYRPAGERRDEISPLREEYVR